MTSQRRQTLGALCVVLAILSADYAYQRYSTALERLTAVEVLLKDSLFDAAVTACNAEALKEEKSERFSRKSSYANAQFRLRQFPGVRSSSAELVLFSGDLVCDYSGLGYARVANQDPEPD